MATKLLILGKGDNIITMILDNLYSHNTMQPVDEFWQPFASCQEFHIFACRRFLLENMR